MWNGEYNFVLQHLVLKDFRIRYRNMSLGVFWSLLNPLVMMGVLTFVFTKVLPSSEPNFPLFLMCGLVPFNFFSIAWISGTTSLIDNANLIKRVPFPREIVPIASVLSNTLHLLIQIALLLSLALWYGKGVTIQWLWLPLVWILEIVLVCGMALAFSCLNVYTRDIRYLVESASTVKKFTVIYDYNPLAAVVQALRYILLQGSAPPASLMWKLTGGSLAMLAAGFLLFRRLKRGFYNHV